MNASPISKVVSLNGIGRERSPGHRILGECRDQLLESLTDWLREVAAPVSEELFLLADSTRERLKQTRYLDLRADVEKDWPLLIDAFRRDLSDESERCLDHNAPHPANPTAPLDIPDFEGLQLVADADLSEHIVIREFSAQLTESSENELYALDRRVAALLGQDEPVEGGNPLAPPVVCQALTDACAALGTDAESRLLLLRRLERHLHLALPPIYQQINARLIERGILPDLKRSYRRGGAGTAAAQVAASLAPMTGETPAIGAAPRFFDQDMLGALERLVQARTKGQGATAAPAGQAAAGSAQPAHDAAQLSQLFLRSLDAIQHEVSGPLAFDGPTVNRVRIIRDSEVAQQADHLQAVTIDIVAMLFDFIFDDRDIPAAVKALVSRLQIPVLKVAMLDSSFFADRTHPARRFLASISGISVRWGSAVDEKDPFYGKLAELVLRIQNEFESDIGVFGTALLELDAFVSEKDNEADSTVQAAAELVARHERETGAWELAQQTVKAFRKRQLPALIDHFLGEFWLPALQRTALENGTDDPAWLVSVGVMEELAWSVEAKKSQNDRLKLISLLPRLLTQLNRGLDSIDADPEQRRAFFDSLVQYHSAALKGEVPGSAASAPEKPELAEPAVALPPAASQGEGDLLVMRSEDNGVQVEEIMLVGASPVWGASDREAFRLVGELRRGDWLEFRQEDGSTSRERLNWISPQRGILVFSNHRAAKAISISPEALARQLRDGKAAVVRDEPLFERALNGVLESLNGG